MPSNSLKACADQEGEQRVWTQKYRASQQYWSGSPEKSQNYQASIQCWAIIGNRQFKLRFAGGPMMARLLWYLDPPYPHQLKIGVKVGPPLTNFSASAHVE